MNPQSTVLSFGLWVSRDSLQASDKHSKKGCPQRRVIRRLTEASLATSDVIERMKAHWADVDRGNVPSHPMRYLS